MSNRVDYLRFIVLDDGMSVMINIAAAKAKLSELVARAEAGEEVIIARDGKPVVVLTPTVRPPGARRPLGVWDGFGANIPEDLFIGSDDDTAAAIAAWEASPVDPAA
jgi:prevent-host-death family protein